MRSDPTSDAARLLQRRPSWADIEGAFPGRVRYHPDGTVTANIRGHKNLMLLREITTAHAREERSQCHERNARVRDVPVIFKNGRRGELKETHLDRLKHKISRVPWRVRPHPLARPRGSHVCHLGRRCFCGAGRKKP